MVGVFTLECLVNANIFVGPNALSVLHKGAKQSQSYYNNEVITPLMTAYEFNLLFFDLSKLS